MHPFNLTTWRDDFKEREIEPSDLDKIIKPGFQIAFGSACSEPTMLTNQLVNEKWKWPDLRMIKSCLQRGMAWWSSYLRSNGYSRHHRRSQNGTI